MSNASIFHIFFLFLWRKRRREESWAVERVRDGVQGDGEYLGEVARLRVGEVGRRVWAAGLVLAGLLAGPVVRLDSTIMAWLNILLRDAVEPF